MSLNSTISARILVLRAAGMDTKAAFDAVLGAGSFERMAGELYDALRSKSGR